MPPWVRYAFACMTAFFAGVHLVRPDLAIDTTFLGLLAVAVLLAFYELESAEFLGSKWKRREVERAQRKAEEIQIPENVPPLPKVPESPHGLQEHIEHKDPTDLWPPTDPHQAVLWAAEQIRVELIVLMGNSGTEFPRQAFHQYQINQVASFLVAKGHIPSAFLEPIQTVAARQREMILGNVLPEALLLSSANLAYDILAKLRKVRRNYYRVRLGSVKVYADRSCSSPLPVQAVMIVNLDDDGLLKHVHVFPSETLYTTGRFVTWEWSNRLSPIAEAWYQSPESRNPELAWARGAVLFAGREYPEEWGLKYRVSRPDDGLLDKELP